jgi:hypothetical protein
VALARTIELCPREVGDALRVNAFVSSGWYPIEQFAQIHDAAQRACNEGHELSRALGRDGLLEDFRTGVNRLITLAIAPEAIFKWAPRVLGLYYDRGRIVIEESHAGRAMGRFEGFDGFTRSVWEDLLGGCVGALELAGAKNVTVRTLSGGQDGDPHLGISVRWTS